MSKEIFNSNYISFVIVAYYEFARISSAYRFIVHAMLDANNNEIN